MTSRGADTMTPALLDPQLAIPLYHQVYVLLRDRIISGRLVPGARLPGEMEMSGLLGVSRITIKRALNELANEGLVYRSRGRGTIVSDGRVAPLIAGSFDTLLTALEQMGLATHVELLTVAETPADRDVAERLQMSPGRLVQRSVRLRKLRGEPFSYLVNYVPIEIARRYASTDLASASMLTLLAQAGFMAREAEQWITATSAGADIAAALAVPAGSPLLRIERVMKSRVPIHFIIGYYRPDRFQYHLRTKRSARGGPGWTDDA